MFDDVAYITFRLGLTCCIFYYKDRLVELEPIGPLEELGPGGVASYTETWTLAHFPFPGAGEVVDLAAVTAIATGTDLV